MGRNQRRTIGAAAAVLVAATALAACGSSSSTDTTASTAAMNTATTAATSMDDSSASTKVAVVLNEMNVMAMPGEAKAGDVTFDVKNEGAAEHNMVVIKTDKMAADLSQSGAQASEAGKVGAVAELAAGQSKKLTLNLAAGHYVLICNVPGHYAAGMYQDFTVN